MDVNQVSCVLCHRREETEVSGALSTKDEVTAHQNCLLFSSGLFCRSSPQFDDLFGFTVEDVLNEVKRGSKLMCNKCKKKGATAGCEVKRCKKSYHYPCAVQDGANNVEDADQGKYGLYCFHHYQETQRHNGCPASFTQCRPSNRASEAGSSKVYCPACKETEGRISLDSLSNSVVVSHCLKHAPASRQSNGDSTAARRLSACSSDSDSCGSMATPSSTKRKLSFRDKREGGVSKRKGWNVISTDDSSNSDESESGMFAPVDTDFEESANSVPEARLIRKDGESPTGSTSGNQVEDASIDGKDEEDEEDEAIMHSDAESESLLLPVCRPPSTQNAATQSPRVVLLKSEEAAAARRSDRGSGPVHSPTPHHSPPCTSSAIPLLCPFPPPLAPPSDPSLSFHSTRFWKNCNAAGCTRALFTGFINEMNAISSRIQSDLASQEDYDHALTVMTASGKLEGLVAEQQEELQRKQTELLTASGAMKEVVSALKTRVHQQKL